MQSTKPKLNVVGETSLDDTLDPKSFKGSIFVSTVNNKNEISLSRSFASWCSDHFKHVLDKKEWVIWSGVNWERDLKARVLHEISEIVLLSNFEDKYKRSATVN